MKWTRLLRDQNMEGDSYGGIEHGGALILRDQDMEEELFLRDQT